MDQKEYRELRCRDGGTNCEFLVRAETEEEVLSLAGEHACRIHGVCEMTLELRSKMKSLMKSVWCLDGICTREPQETDAVYWN